MDRDGLLRKIQQERQELLMVLNRISDDQMEVSLFPNGWSFKDFLGHLGFWEKRALEIFHYFKEESIPDPKPGTLSLDEMNALAYTASHNLSLEAVRSSERDAYQNLIKLVESASDEELFNVQHFPLTEGKPFATWIEDNTFGHYQEHLPEIRAVLNLPGWIQYTAEGQNVRAYTAHAREEGPGVIVLHAWWGLNAFFQRQCDRLAEQGFTVLAPDLYAGKLANTIEEAEALMHERGDNDFVQTAVMSAVERLRRQPGITPGPVGVVGFSMGAAWALVLSAAQSDDIAATVVFYGVYDEVDFKRSRSAYQGHFAEKDVFEPIEGVHSMEEAMKTAGRSTDFYIYPGTTHWFFEDDRPDAFQPEAAQQAWSRTLAFLKENIGA